MATIRESLVIDSNIAAVFSSYLNLGRQMAASMRVVTETQNDFTAAANQSGAALEEMASAGSRAADSVEDFSDAAQKMASGSNGAANGQERLNNSMRNGASAAGGLYQKVMRLAAAYMSLRSAQSLINLSDTWTQTTARLDMVNEKYGTDTDLSGMIHQSALRSGSPYLDTAEAVSKMALNAGAAFSAPEEVVAFMEQINKQFQIAGASATEQKNAMIQLTQAMAAGTLRGEELNSILDQAPGIARAIENYMGIAEGSIKSYAEQGLITAQVVKNAMFETAEETENRYNQIPMTWSRAWETAKTEAIFAIEPVLKELNAFLNSDIGRNALDGFITAVRMGADMLLWLVQLMENAATIIMENWDTVSEALIIGAITVASVMVASAAKAAVAWAIANWPLLLIVGTIALVIYAARQMGATWADIGGVFAAVGAFIGNVFVALWNTAAEVFAAIWNVVAMVANFVGNVFIDPVGAVIRLFFDLADTVLSILQAIASAIDAIFGTELASGMQGWRNSLSDWVDDTFGSGHEIIAKVSAEDWKLDRFAYGEAFDAGHDFVSNLGDKWNELSNATSNGFDFDYDALLAASGINDTLNDIGADTKAIRNSVALSEEDIKLLVDMATREYVNNINLTAQTPIINVTGQNTGDTEMDKRALADAIRDILIEESASHTDLAYT